MMKRMSMLAVILLLAAMSQGARPASAAGDKGIEGLWQGTLQGMLRLVVHVERGPSGTFTGTMDSPDQGALGLAIDTLVVTSDSLRFEMRLIRGQFAGARSSDGDSIVGVWRQAGMGLPLTLRRGEKPMLWNRPQEPQRPYPYDTVAVTFRNPRAPDVMLAGTLTVPRGKGRFPGALLITGSGPEDRDETVFGHRPFLVLADHLTRQGIAVLRVDDRGVGASTGHFRGATSEDFASDALAGVEFLRARREIDPRHIGLIGHSEGGLIAPMVAARSKEVSFVVLMAGPGIPGDSTLLLQSAALRRSMGGSEEAIARERTIYRRMYGLLRQGDSVGVVRSSRELVQLQLEALPDEQRRALGDPDSIAVQAVERFFSPWMRFFLFYDPRPALRQVRCPVLAINGEKDVQVLPKENLAAIEDALKGNRAATVKELPGLNHLFQACRLCTVAEYPQIEETMAPAALDEMSGWIRAHAIAKR